MANTDPGAPEYQYEWQNPNRNTFDFGRVLVRAFSGTFSNIKVLGLAFLIAIGLTIIVSVFSTDQMSGLIGDGTPEAVEAATLKPAYWGWTSLSALFTTVITLWVQLVVVKTSYAHFTQTPLEGSPLTSTLRFILPMLVIAIIYYIVCAVGFLFLLVGFVFVWPGWALAGPILVHEKKGIFDSIGEAWNLSKGSKRWIILLLFLLLFITIIAYVLAIGLSIAFTGVNSWGGDTSAVYKMSIGQQIIYNSILGLATYFTYSIFASGLTAAYVEIKMMKGGISTIGSIFN